MTDLLGRLILRKLLVETVDGGESMGVVILDPSLNMLGTDADCITESLLGWLKELFALRGFC